MHLTVFSLTHLHVINSFDSPKNPTKVNTNTIHVLQMKNLRISVSGLWGRVASEPRKSGSRNFTLNCTASLVQTTIIPNWEDVCGVGGKQERNTPQRQTWAANALASAVPSSPLPPLEPSVDATDSWPPLHSGTLLHSEHASQQISSSSGSSFPP